MHSKVKPFITPTSFWEWQARHFVFHSFLLFHILQNSMVTWTKQKKLKQKRKHLSQQVSQNGKLFSDSIPVTYTDIHTLGICGKTLLIVVWQMSKTTQFDGEKKKNPRDQAMLLLPHTVKITSSSPHFMWVSVWYLQIEQAQSFQPQAVFTENI